MVWFKEVRFSFSLKPNLMEILMTGILIFAKGKVSLATDRSSSRSWFVRDMSIWALLLNPNCRMANLVLGETGVLFL